MNPDQIKVLLFETRNECEVAIEYSIDSRVLPPNMQFHPRTKRLARGDEGVVYKCRYDGHKAVVKFISKGSVFCDALERTIAAAADLERLGVGAHIYSTSVIEAQGVEIEEVYDEDLSCFHHKPVGSSTINSEIGVIVMERFDTSLNSLYDNLYMSLYAIRAWRRLVLSLAKNNLWPIDNHDGNVLVKKENNGVIRVKLIDNVVAKCSDDHIQDRVAKFEKYIIDLRKHVIVKNTSQIRPRQANL
jgi:hypothetical protein